MRLIIFAILLLSISCSSAKLTDEVRLERSLEFLRKAERSWAAGKVDEAEKYCRKAIRTDSANSSAYLLAAQCLIRKQDEENALRMLSFAPARRAASYDRVMGELRFSRRQYNEAVEHLERAVRDFPGDAYLVGMLAENYSSLGNMAAMTLIINDFLDKHPDTSDERILRLHQLSSGKSFEMRHLESLAHARPITRGDLAFLMVMTLDGKNPVVLDRVFEDVSPQDSLQGYYARAVDSGFLEELPDRKFHPTRQISRRNLINYLSRQLVTVGELPKLSWRDVASNDPLARHAVRVVGLNLIRPVTQDNLGPELPVTGNETLAALILLKKLQIH